MPSPRVLYLSYDGLTDPLGQSQILPYLIGLSKKGYVFTIISFEKENAFRLREKEIKSICQENAIEWIPFPYHKRPPVLSTLYDVLKLWRKVKKRYRQRGFEIIHCRSYITSLIGLEAKRKWNVKFIFDMRGFWADERVEGGLWNLKNPVFRVIYNFFKKREKEFLREADHIVSLTYNAKAEIELRKIGNAPIAVIPTCVDMELFNPEIVKKEDQEKLKARLGIRSDDFVLLYLGSWGTWYMTNEMFDFFNILRQNNEFVKFLIVTPDSETKIREEAFARKVDMNSIIIQKAKRQEIPLYISIVNCSILFIKPTFSKRASSPTKLGEILSMGVSVVANTSVGDIDFLFEMDDIGILISKFTTQDYSECVKGILEGKCKSSDRLRDFVSKQLSLNKGVEIYEGIYTGLL